MRCFKSGHTWSGDERGVALPLALLGLISVSILVTAVLVSGSTELGLSQAHRDGSRELFIAEGGLEAFVADAQDANALNVVFDLPYLPNGAQSSDSVLINVRRILQRGGGTWQQNVYSITSQPMRGGRTVGGMVEVTETNQINFNITAAATFGGNAEIEGDAVLVSDGSREVVGCQDPEVSENAIVNASGSTLTIHDNPTIVGNTVTSDLGKEELIRKTLGTTIRGLLPRATRKFGSHFSMPAFGSVGGHEGKPSSLRNNNQLRDTAHVYNWRCPGGMDDQNNCAGRGADTTVYHIIAIDAQNGQVTLNGDHGQGLLVVINGRLRIQGGFIFRGVIVAEQDIDMAGTGNKVQGAIISQNNINLDQRVEAGDTTTSIRGNAMVVYNSCAVDEVMRALNPEEEVPQALGFASTFSWFERVR